MSTDQTTPEKITFSSRLRELFSPNSPKRNDGEKHEFGRSTSGADGSPTLRPLSPTYIKEQHGDYVEILKSELTKTGREVPLNIALTGHYGSGKSSVLMETQRELARTVEVVNLSLPSLGVGDGRIPTDENKSLNTTNLIQKEIVKQLLYRQKPSDMPASRYSRLDIFHFWRAMPTAIGVGVAATALALIAQVPSKVRDALPAKAWEWINAHFWWSLATPIQWLSLLLVFGLAVLSAVWIQRLLQQRIRVTELAAGPTKVTLSDSSSSYFDEYLDEIVYFFQTSKTKVVIFEDLDRFKDPHIFETLRELNLLLNNAEQTGESPIRFVYAIRDSIFEQLSVDSDGGDNGNRANERETRRLTSTNRTKFFDLVVPMVPFISHRTSRDLIRDELKAVPEDQRPQNKVIDIVGAHLTDMRLIKNICNEYEVFRRKILAAGGIEALTPDRLFASVVYKNLYLADYEQIRDGTSPLDRLYDAYRVWVTQQTAAARVSAASARARLRRIDAVGLRSVDLGARLQAVLLARHVPNVRESRIEVVASGIPFAWDAIQSVSFWQTYLSNRGPLNVRYQPGYPGEDLTFEKVQTLMGYALSVDDWTEEDTTEAAEQLASAEADQRTVQHSTMTQALLDTGRHFEHGRRECSLLDVAKDLFDGSDLVLELLHAGYIDENFTLYVTQFPGQAISASAMNFIIKAVQADAMDIEYHFGSGDEVDTGDIEAVLQAENTRLLDGQSIYNIELFDYILAVVPEILAGPIGRLARNASTETIFIDAYLASGKMAGELVERLSATWSGVFDYLLGSAGDYLDEGLLNAAFRGVSQHVVYELDVKKKEALEHVLPRLSVFAEPQSQKRSAVIAHTIMKLGIRVHKLDEVADPLRHELVKRNLYPVTLANLQTIFGVEESLALDDIKADRKSDVYPHVLAHLANYLEALDQVEEVPTVNRPDRFVDVMSDVGEADVDAMEDVARRASENCTLINIREIDAPLWPAFAGAHRLSLSAQNVASYIAEHQLDSDLASWLRTAGEVVVGPDDPTPLVPLALDILNAEALNDDASVRIVGRLRLDSGSIPAKDLKKHARSMLPSLVKKGIVPDDSDAFTILDDDEWTVKEKLISTSRNFPTYMGSLTPKAEDLRRFAVGKVPEAIKDALLENLDTFGVNLGPNGAAALARRAAAGTGHSPTPDVIVILATKGGARTARSIIRLLGKNARTIDLELLKRALNALGAPYNQLTSPGRERPKPDAMEGLPEVLARLSEEGIVSKFVENSRKGVFEVSKKHS